MKKKGWKPLSSKKEFNIEFSGKMKKMNTQFLTSKKKKITVTKESSDTHIKILKEENLEDVTEKFMERILDLVNQNVQDALKKFQDTKNTEEDTETNKGTQRGLQQTPK
jgi:hypothetical protein